MTLYNMGGFMATLVLDLEVEVRVVRAVERVVRLGLSKTWIAEEIGRSRQNVSEVLNKTTSSPGTLALIEDLLDKVEAGRVVV